MWRRVEVLCLLARVAGWLAVGVLCGCLLSVLREGHTVCTAVAAMALVWGREEVTGETGWGLGEYSAACGTPSTLTSITAVLHRLLLLSAP